MPDSVVEAYDPVTDTWSRRKADMPTPRAEHGVSVVNGIIYATGGYTSVQPYMAENQGCCSVMEAYDPGTNTWSRKANMPVRRRAMRTEAVDGKIYSLGGELRIKNDAGAWTRNFYKDVYAYDPGIDTWSRKADMPDTHAWFGSCVLNGEIYVVSGWWQENSQTFIDVYNPGSDTWRSLSPLGYHLINSYGGQAAATLDGKIYIVGGWNTNDGRVHIYDPESDTLTQGPGVGVPTRYYLAAITLDEKMYLMGGGGGIERNDVYDPLAAPPVQQIRSVEVKDKLILV